MKKWIVWLKKNSPWIFLLIGPVLNFYLLEWYTHNPFQTMKPYIQGMNLALFEFAALFLFALTGRISRALGIETAFCAIYGLANYFVLEFRGPSSRGTFFRSRPLPASRTTTNTN
mgnify:CR=1 FL=1